MSTIKNACTGLILSGFLSAVFLTGTAYADIVRSDVAFNNGIGQKTASQPANGVEVSYQVTLKGGDLDGCTVDIVEALHPRDDGAWGIFDIQGDVACQSGGFSYSSSGAWDGNGFHASGHIKSGSGSGDYQNVSGRVAQLGGSVADAGNGTLDVSYALVFDMSKN